MQGGVGQVESRGLGEHGCVDAGHLLGEPEPLGKVDVSDQRASRSRSSLSRSSSFLAREVKSLSERTLSISAVSESTMRLFRLVPLTRATASAASARSSGSRT